MLAAILILMVLPFYKMPQNTIVPPLSDLHKIFFWLFIGIFFMLLFLGGKPATAPYVISSQIFTFLYFFYFLVIVPIIPELELYLLDYEISVK